MGTSPLAAEPPTWRDHETCPFCGASLPDGGPGFVDHVASNPACETDFDAWRDRVVEDIRGGWPG